LLYQSLAIENPKVKFAHVLPATVEGNFRAGAVDGGAVHENLKGALKPDYVAQRCIEAVDYNQGNVFLPWSYSVYHKLYWIIPSLVTRGAKKKYNF
jgi:short-subunit dehydrogenase